MFKTTSWLQSRLSLSSILLNILSNIQQKNCFWYVEFYIYDCPQFISRLNEEYNTVLAKIKKGELPVSQNAAKGKATTTERT